jgi:hypothetical protein
MRDRRAKGIHGVETKIFISESQDRAIDRLLLELRLSYGINVSRKDLCQLAIGMMLAHSLPALAEYIERV